MSLTISNSFLFTLRRVLIVLTVACALYAVYFMFIHSRGASVEEPIKPVEEDVVIPELVLDPPVDESALTAIKKRDLFSASSKQTLNAASVATPTGQLPAHLKVVGIVISEPSQVIIEDTSIAQTHFISEGKPQAGISIARVNKNEVIINYQGEAISLPIQNPQSSVDNATSP